MAKSLLALSLLLLGNAAFAQQKEFEGSLSYKIDLRSKIEGVGERAYKTALLLGDTVNLTIKKGNSRQSSGNVDMYFISKDQKAYLKFKGIDTLFFMDYSSDTSTVLSQGKTDEKKRIAGIDCMAFTFQVPHAKRTYYYSPALYLNPEYDKNNRFGRYDVYVKATSALYLGYTDITETYDLTQTCTRIQEGAVDESDLRLPNLPQAPLNGGNLMVQPQFVAQGGWNKYLEKNLDGSLGAKYIKIPKGEQTAQQTVYVQFLVNEHGRVFNARVLNKDDVHPKLADEALRVVTNSPPWRPATILGQNTFGWLKQAITFQATK